MSNYAQALIGDGNGFIEVRGRGRRRGRGGRQVEDARQQPEVPAGDRVVPRQQQPAVVHGADAEEDAVGRAANVAEQPVGQPRPGQAGAAPLVAPLPRREEHPNNENAPHPIRQQEIPVELMVYDGGNWAPRHRGAYGHAPRARQGNRQPYYNNRGRGGRGGEANVNNNQLQQEIQDIRNEVAGLRQQLDRQQQLLDQQRQVIEQLQQQENVRNIVRHMMNQPYPY